jgi:tetratricopeptide (TPR) repeat protein
MRGLGFAQSDGSLKIKVRLHDGRIVERVLQTQVANSDIYDPGYSGFDWRFYNLVFGTPIGKLTEWTTAYKGLSTQDFLAPDASRPPFLYYRGAFSKQALTRQDAYFIQINIVQNGKENLRTFFEHAMLEVDQLKPKNLIIDLRNSPGGDGSNVEPILREFTSRRSAPPWKNLYVLVSRRTLSATILLLDALVKNLDLTVIGEPAGAPSNWNADAAGFDLGRTGFHLEVSARHHQLGESNDVKAFVPVDVAAPFSFADFAAGRDPALDPVLRGEEMRAIAVIARADGGYAARLAYLARKQRSATDTTWAAPSEPELRQAGKALEDQKRVADAIETFRLSSEIHPDEWRSWYNLAEAQWRAQFKQDAVESYRKCLALNDPTNFNRERLEKLVADADASKEKPR